MKTTVTIRNNWLVTVPKTVREKMKLKVGDVLELDVKKVEE